MNLYKDVVEKKEKKIGPMVIKVLPPKGGLYHFPPKFAPFFFNLS